ncbi:hypothetical protein PE143B_0124720 [Pseudomonas extremaustralis 14-3 substr. 14-3b]|nr:hypothetical protein PE143B_0124720 [Pseudomonas extremaustralis 14-3 substr. 14-3b]
MLTLLNYFRGFRLVWAGRRFGNDVAKYLGVDRRLFHNALELGGLHDHLVLLGFAVKANQDIGDVAMLVSGYLIDGIEVMKVRFGARPMMTAATRNVLMFRGEVEGIDPMELVTSVLFARGVAYRATR